MNDAINKALGLSLERDTILRIREALDDALNKTKKSMLSNLDTSNGLERFLKNGFKGYIEWVNEAADRAIDSFRNFYDSKEELNALGKERDIIKENMAKETSIDLKIGAFLPIAYDYLKIKLVNSEYTQKDKFISNTVDEIVWAFGNVEEMKGPIKFLLDALYDTHISTLTSYVPDSSK